MRGTVLADEVSSKEVGECTARIGAFFQLDCCKAQSPRHCGTNDGGDEYATALLLKHGGQKRWHWVWGHS